jgi:hypothetical protein
MRAMRSCRGLLRFLRIYLDGNPGDSCASFLDLTGAMWKRGVLRLWTERLACTVLHVLVMRQGVDCGAAAADRLRFPDDREDMLDRVRRDLARGLRRPASGRRD